MVHTAVAASIASPMARRTLPGVEQSPARQLHILYMTLNAMLLFHQRRPKKKKWREGPTQPFEKARFAERNSLDFSSPGLDFPSALRAEGELSGPRELDGQ